MATKTTITLKKTDKLERVHTPLKTESGEKSEIRLLDPKLSAALISKKKETSEKLIKDAVNEYVKYHALEKSYKDQKDEAAQVIREYVGAVRDANAYEGDYQKTYRVLGKKDDTMQFSADVSQNDKFSIPKTADMTEIKTALGDATFDELFQKTTTISIKPEIMSNDTLRKEFSSILVDKLGMDGLKKYFVKEEVWQVKDGTDTHQYKIPKEKRDILLEHVNPSADTVKNSTSKS